MVYRSRESHLGKTPEARARQLSNLKNRWNKGGSDEPIEDSFGPKRLQEANIIEFATEFLGASFEERPAQEVILRSLYGLPLNGGQLGIYGHLTGNDIEFEPELEKTEAVLCLGARSGKSFLSSICALYEATRDKWRQYLNSDENGYIIVVATKQKQAEQIIGRNCARMIENSKIAYMVKESWQTELALKNGMSIISMPCNSTAGRGLPIACLILDELAHYRVEGPKADEAIYDSLRPRMSQFRGAKLFAISTPAAKQGLFWQFYDEGPQIPSRLTVKAETKFMNPMIDEKFIESEYRRNPDNAEREFGGNFAEQVSAFFPIDKLQECFVLAGDLPCEAGYRYSAGIDQSGLAGRDRFAFAIAHKDGKTDKTIVDVTRTWNTTSSDTILEDIRQLTAAYKIRSVTIDRYAGGWVKSALEKLGLEVEVRENLASVYSNLKSLVIAGRVELPDNVAMKTGLIRTQAFYGRGNTLSIAHERSTSGHGDEADAVATAVWEASKEQRGPVLSEHEKRLLDLQQAKRNNYDPLTWGL